MKKCSFFKKHIQYLGHLISEDRIQPLPEKLESIAKMPAPKNPKEVKQFLGLVGYYRKFVPSFTDISRVFNTLNEKRCRIQMDSRMQKLFPDIKRLPTKGTNTQIPRPAIKLHPIHRCIKIHIRRHVNTRHRRDRSPHHLHKRTLPRLTIELGNTHKRSICNLHVSEKNLSFYIDTAKITVKSNHLPLKKFLEKNNPKLQGKQLGSRTGIPGHHIQIHPLHT